MGTYLNPGKQNYQMAVNSEIFVDKTEMIRYLNTVINTQQRFVSVSRPRRFGKTMAADMICAYYDREADCFMCGDRILVCPVFDEGVNEVNVRLPQSTGAFRLRGQGPLIEGGRSVKVSCTISDLPIWFTEVE